jgi:hypothetical protein
VDFPRKWTIPPLAVDTSGLVLIRCLARSTFRRPHGEGSADAAWRQCTHPSRVTVQSEGVKLSRDSVHSLLAKYEGHTPLSSDIASRLHLIKYFNLVVFESPASPLRESTGALVRIVPSDNPLLCSFSTHHHLVDTWYKQNDFSEGCFQPLEGRGEECHTTGHIDTRWLVHSAVASLLLLTLPQQNISNGQHLRPVTMRYVLFLSPPRTQQIP